MAKKKYYSGGRYSNNGFISDNPSQPCYLPDQVIDKDFPRQGQAYGQRYDDLFSGEERSSRMDASDIRKIVKKDR